VRDARNVTKARGERAAEVTREKRATGQDRNRGEE